jgi:hypothetical protein
MLPYFVKYGAREHVRNFFQRGAVQVGTVRAYDQATFGDRVGDDDEGFSRQAIHDGNIAEHRAAGYPEPGVSGFSAFGPGSYGNLVMVTNLCHNYAIYPVSMCLHKELCQNFHETYDAAIVIFEPFVFFQAITSAFAASGQTEGVEFRHVRPINYRSRDIGPGEFLQEEFIKDPQYQHQCEVRASWMIGNPTQRFYRFDAPWARWQCLPLLLEDMPNYEPGSPRELIDDQIRRAFESGDQRQRDSEWSVMADV